MNEDGEITIKGKGYKVIKIGNNIKSPNSFQINTIFITFRPSKTKSSLDFPCFSAIQPVSKRYRWPDESEAPSTMVNNPRKAFALDTVRSQESATDLPSNS